MTSSAPPPQASPQPPTPGTGDSGTFPALKEDLRKTEKHQILTTIGTAVLAISTAFGGYHYLINEAKAQVDAGVADLRQRQTLAEEAQRRAQATTDNRLDRLEKGQERADAKFDAFKERTDAKLDAVLAALRVRNPAPAPPRDGGE